MRIDNVLQVNQAYSSALEGSATGALGQSSTACRGVQCARLSSGWGKMLCYMLSHEATPAFRSGTRIRVCRNLARAITQCVWEGSGYAG